MQIETVILIHGFFRNQTDMYPLRDYLNQNGYIALTPSLPTTFNTIESCCEVLERFYDGLNLRGKAVHFIGHSMGGLIVRIFLSKRSITLNGKAILIAAPNHGAKLADMSYAMFRPFLSLFKGLTALRKEAIQNNPFLKNETNRFGVIAGINNRLLTGLLLSQSSDGRVELESTTITGMQDYITLPFVHTQIHHRPETHEAILRYLRTGKFRM